MTIVKPDDDGHFAGLPCAQALVAGTTALMTAWALPEPADEPEADADPAADAGARDDAGQAALALDARRQRLARQIVSNLFFLREHPQLSPALRQVMAQAHARWVLLCGGTQGQAAAAADAAGPRLH